MAHSAIQNQLKSDPKAGESGPAGRRGRFKVTNLKWV